MFFLNKNLFLFKKPKKTDLKTQVVCFFKKSELKNRWVVLFSPGFLNHDYLQLFDMVFAKNQSNSYQSDTAEHFNLNAMLLPATDTTWAYSFA